MQSQNMSNVQPIEPNTVLDISMEAQEWNFIVEVLCRTTGFSYVQTAPLIEKLSKQMQEKVQRRGLQEVRTAG